ncbi:MAG TPA: serine hydroxymethyltransferase [Gordonia sp. (in: high G+C Gram-positive bacteria)]|uniref:serine hydroxymethyltransferase n=1 Tax=unclassified Gordonia (in: high G+C Gram-positive bacteria) TaxID=2657482 RepID=UPI000FB9FE03|nr:MULTISPECIES: serine hydroxymethyltransferase [unclassified Gordonia (in: high G+C Gram-positive bacteria)]RUP35568.1 MAG: aminotransferase class I/II-fold pyridoxal phosphate-dependent enzyme [Gordonia sp. (in: high G+C Gram-positive bacteria)]HNP57456.1 serine hydroxymethyltransferase [Gordonia sp. (in: high G+C Gram-positive bacteria)]HRC51221.1 serine hydroxymethyltransferase [Gordonia sp. (in: high G+C Gram-positive bacteria)]
MSGAPLRDADPAVAGLVDAEVARRATTVSLIASESVSTPGVRAALGSEFGDKYAEGHPGHRYHGGCEVVDELEELAVARARELFGAEYADVQPVSGSVANLAVYAAFAQPDDAVLALSLRHGGHQTHGSRANFSGRWFTPVSYELDMSDERIDYDKLRDTAMFYKPRILVAGASGYSRHIDFAAMRSIADEAGCILWVDAAHIAGLAIAGIGPSPVEYADVVTVSTQKIMRGPRGGVILGRAEHADALRRAVYPFVQGGPNMAAIAAKAVAFAESATSEYRDYARRVVENAAALASALVDGGLRVVSGGTDNHLAVIDVTELGLTGRAAADALGAAGIVVDKAVLPFDPAPVALGSAFRVGTPTVTSAGQTVSDMAVLAARILDVLAGAAR